jgi:O-antigen/teichoic acid export membrane protein
MKDKAVTGVVWLSLGRIINQVAITGGNILIARLLVPEVVGRYSIMMFIVGTVGMVVNLGLGEALVQTKDELDAGTLNSVHWLSVTFGLVGWAALILVLPLIIWFYKDNYFPEILFLPLILVFTRWKTIPGILLEKSLEFRKISLVEFVEVAAMQIVALAAIIGGLKELGLVMGVIVGKFTGMVVAQVTSKWGPKSFSIDTNLIKKYFSFAWDLQINGLLSQMDIALIMVLVAKFLGNTQVGLVVWAMGISLALRMIGDIVARVTFPVVAQIGDDKQKLFKTLKYSLLAGGGVNWIMIIVFWIFAERILSLIFNHNWLVGLPLLYWYLVNSMFVSIENILIKVVQGVGESRFLRNLKAIVLLGVWIGVFVGLPRIGVVSVPILQTIASAIMSSVLLVRIFRLK